MKGGRNIGLLVHRGTCINSFVVGLWWIQWPWYPLIKM